MSILESLSKNFMISTGELRSFIKTAPYRYKVYPIPKKSGKGFRIIAQPSDVLKMMQRIVLEEFLSELPIHSCAAAYREGLSIKDNAETHVKNQYLLKMDFSDFFPSMAPPDLIKHIVKHKGSITEEDAYVVRKLFFWARKQDPTYRLSIGAPSSPFISNTLMYSFDCVLHDYCERLGITYTRYADDITLTTNEKGLLLKMPSYIRGLCKEVDYPTLNVNEQKTVFSSKRSNRHVTGLVINNDGQVSLGRDRKRYIRSLIHKSTLGEMGNEEMHNLKGLIAFAKYVEPGFYRAILSKYGFPALHSIEIFQSKPEVTGALGEGSLPVSDVF